MTKRVLQYKAKNRVCDVTGHWAGSATVTLPPPQPSPEAEFLDAIGTKPYEFSFLLITVLLPTTLEQKWFETGL